MLIGCHLSSSQGFMHMAHTAQSLDANVFQFYTRNPRGSAAKAIDPDDAAAFVQLQQEGQMGPIVAHAPYTLNGCSDDPSKREFATRTLADDLARMEKVPHNYYNLHPGSHMGQGVQVGVAQIATMLNAVMTPEQTTSVLLETMAGKGREVGARFEELQMIIERTELGERLGVCLDTCHVWDGGYDVVDSLDAVLDEFDRVLGLGRLRAIHLNDSMNINASHKDRHAKIGEGRLGLEALVRVINHPALRHLPFILETPNELDGYAREIALLRSLYRESA